MMIFSILFPNILLLCFFIRTLFLKGVKANLRRLVTTEVRPGAQTPGHPLPVPQASRFALHGLSCPSARPSPLSRPHPRHHSKRLCLPQVSILASLDAWRQAGGHVLYSLGLGMGTIITFSSYQTRGENYIKCASFVAMVNLATSLLSSSVTFLVLGFWATTSGSRCVER